MAKKVVVVHHPEGHAAINRRVIRLGEAITKAVANDAEDMAPIDTGKLVSSIHTRRMGTYTWHVVVGTDHWQFQEYGTRGRNPVIVPRVKKALWWQGLARPRAKVTKHFGNDPKPFMRPALMQPRLFWFTPTGGVAVTT